MSGGPLADDLPMVCECQHLHKHTYVIRDMEDAFMVMDLSLRGWIGPGSGYCPAYFPAFLGYEPLPTIGEQSTGAVGEGDGTSPGEEQ